MSMLGSQADRLREAARNIQGKLGRCLYRRKDVDEMQKVSGMLFEAADTIESLRDRLQATIETCELTAFADVPFNVDYEIEGYDSGSSNDYATLAECSKCGAYVIEPPAYHHVLTCDDDEIYQPYNYCPNCGRHVKGGAE